ncbi:MAG TPA: ABC transporter permease [Dinghuibacter sp.]|uniref:ABC transporter permease n=1 Tax=Dinghuibacter sp. TaxID=2024697 RepID=UPI002B678C78|nr:ABC transporter permease [Dinghuibacter sp.]HTJ12447.1 ABC transporter permease [Dinghuibacter sp.]
MSTFFISLRTEFMKIRRSAALWLVVIGSAFLPAIFFLMYTTKPDVFVKRLGKDPWMGHIAQGFEASCFFLWPMLIIVVASMVTQIEYRNNTWKQVLAAPLRIGDVYFAKYLVIQCLVLCAYVLFDVELVLFALLAEVFHPDYQFAHSSLPIHSILQMDAKSYISILGMTTIQYCISLRFKNFIGSIGVGLALIIAGLIMIPWDKVVYFPYAYSALSFIRNSATATEFKVLKHEYWSLGYFAAFLTLGYLDFFYRRERG